MINKLESLLKEHATLEEAEKYYVGNVFNIGIVNDNLQRCIMIKQIN